MEAEAEGGTRGSGDAGGGVNGGGGGGGGVESEGAGGFGSDGFGVSFMVSVICDGGRACQGRMGTSSQGMERDKIAKCFSVRPIRRRYSYRTGAKGAVVVVGFAPARFRRLNKSLSVERMRVDSLVSTLR